jgi:Na+/H+ antiporter NhaD/arsenite permease-like protein
MRPAAHPPRKARKIFAEIDWGILVFFAALFIVTGALDKNGVTTALLSKVHIANRENVVTLAW